jgi:hypothetical protein
MWAAIATRMSWKKGGMRGTFALVSWAERYFTAIIKFLSGKMAAWNEACTT